MHQFLRQRPTTRSRVQCAMGLFIRLLLIVMIVKSQTELQVASSGNQKTFSYEQDTISKIDEVKSIVSNYLELVYADLKTTTYQMEELKVTVTDYQETVSTEIEEIVTSELRNATQYLKATKRKVEELQQAVSSNQETVSSELGDTRRKMEELRAAASTNQETVSSEQEDTTRKIDELQVAVSGIQETVSSKLEDTRREVDELKVAVTSELRNTTHQLKDTVRQVEELQVTVRGNQEMVTSEVQGLRRQLEGLQVSISALVEFLHVALPKDCSEILARGVSMSGVYTVQPLDSGEAFQVYCDMETDGGGWTVFQRRKDGSVDFYLDYASYSRGFGNLEGEFWLGNDYLHHLTAQGDYELHVGLSDFENESRYAVYDSFSIADVSDNYRLTLESYSGNAGDSLSRHNNQQFTTKDRDNDGDGRNCAQSYHGAWWYRTCHHSNLNGEYLRGTTTQHGQGVNWYHWKGNGYSLKTSEMKIRPTPQ